VQGWNRSRQHVVAHRLGGREAGERYGSFGVGFKNIRRSQIDEMRGPAGNGCADVSMAGGLQGQGAGKGKGVRGRRLPSPTCFLTIYYVSRLSVPMQETGSEYPFDVLIPMNSYLFLIDFI